MPHRRWIPFSLDRKISLLFGTAVLLTISVTLVFPWLHMNALDAETLHVRAQWVATAASQSVDLHMPDWSAAQRELEFRWPTLVRDMGLPRGVPRLIPVAAAGQGFHQEAVDRLTENPRQRYYWRFQDDGTVFRLALAVRGTDTDPHPQVLRGLIDVRLSVPPQNPAWNTIVTLLAGAGGAVLAILVFYTVTQQLVLSPVSTLRRVAEQVTRGDLEVRAIIRSGDEFEDFADAFNDMLTHLKAAQEELRKTNRSLDVRLGELAETNVALFESNRVKSDFLANVSHELRTPLVSIIGFAELLRDAWENPEADRTRLRRYSENILISGRGLLEIINDLLDLAKIEAGKMQLHVSEFSLKDLCGDLIDFFRPLADKKRLQLTLTLPPDAPTMTSDSGKIKQILYNLLSNAIKFTPNEGAVTLVVERDESERVRLTVRDTGPGIPSAQHHRIFEKFHQIDASKTREHEGTGLGLAITSELVNILGGMIRMESVEGQGAAFVVTLPLALPNA